MRWWHRYWALADPKAACHRNTCKRRALRIIANSTHTSSIQLGNFVLEIESREKQTKKLFMSVYRNLTLWSSCGLSLLVSAVHVNIISHAFKNIRPNPLEHRHKCYFAISKSNSTQAAYSLQTWQLLQSLPASCPQAGSEAACP